jgi:uncharacterized membrane protein|tara:strand:- start:5544 stop:5828 length:285 start_codon:yes stop_codon:yes gene_type:complete
MSGEQTNFVFGKKNYTAIIIGFVIVLIGFVMMSGGKAESPDEFNPDEIFSARRITYAPITVLVGFTIIGVGIMLKPEDDLVAEEFAKDKTGLED